MHADAVAGGARVLVHDDLLATGGTAAAVCDLIEKAGGEVVGCAFLAELAFLGGREQAARLRRPEPRGLRLRIDAHRRPGTHDRRAARTQVWELVSDPYHLPRWWPTWSASRTSPTEAWTTVATSSRGRSVRFDFAARRTRARPSRIVWRQELEETPFERYPARVGHRGEPRAGRRGSTRVELRIRAQAARAGALRRLPDPARGAARARRRARPARSR